ncbi:unnamed protein product [Mycena citricolor]|uniref:Zn(2)-C6 fungal-type domain-containing protein n=1 Tax=Mycena citricolor TaxID=2018698 RepID=A0AAD2HGX2_9AGAR|nr:unnamed protein product [Mycena citricolor]
MPGSATSSKPAVDSSVFSTRRRAYMACTNCRHRKIKCIAPADGDFGPCKRCAKRDMACEYVAVPEEMAYERHNDYASPDPTNYDYTARNVQAGRSRDPQPITLPSASLNEYMRPSGGLQPDQRASFVDYSSQWPPGRQPTSGLPSAGYMHPGYPYSGAGSDHQRQYAQQPDYVVRGQNQPVTCACPHNGPCYCGGNYHQ